MQTARHRLYNLLIRKSRDGHARYRLGHYMDRVKSFFTPRTSPASNTPLNQASPQPRLKHSKSHGSLGTVKQPEGSQNNNFNLIRSQSLSSIDRLSGGGNVRVNSNWMLRFLRKCEGSEEPTEDRLTASSNVECEYVKKTCVKCAWSVKSEWSRFMSFLKHINSLMLPILRSLWILKIIINSYVYIMTWPPLLILACRSAASTSSRRSMLTNQTLC